MRLSSHAGKHHGDRGDRNTDPRGKLLDAAALRHRLQRHEKHKLPLADAELILHIGDDFLIDQVARVDQREDKRGGFR